MSSTVDHQDAWLSIGAAEEESSVEPLSGNLDIDPVLDVGCGTGAVLAEIVRRGIGSACAARVLGPRALLLPYYGHFAVLVDHGSPDDRSTGAHPLFWHPGSP